MKQEIEKNVRKNNPVEVIGMDEQKIKDLISTFMFLAGQKGKTVRCLQAYTTAHFSIREVHIIAHRLMAHHRLRVLAFQPDRLWHTSNC